MAAQTATIATFPASSTARSGPRERGRMIRKGPGAISALQPFLFPVASRCIRRHVRALHLHTGANECGHGPNPRNGPNDVIGRTAFTTYTPGATYNTVKPGEAVMIRVLRIKPGETPPPGAFPAQDIVNTIGPRLKAQS